MNSLQLFASTGWAGNVMLVVAVGLISGAASMVLYRWVSPQKKLKVLQQKLMESQKKMADYEGEFAGLWKLIRLNLKLAMQRVGWSFGPSLVAGIPVIAAFIVLDVKHDNLVQDMKSNRETTVSTEVDDGKRQITSESVNTIHEDQLDYFPIGPSWVRSWIFAFILFTTISALVIRQFQGAV